MRTRKEIEEREKIYSGGSGDNNKILIQKLILEVLLDIRDLLLNPSCEHEWFVYSASLFTIEILVKCIKCNQFGSIQSFSEEEWCKAFDAPEEPYLWKDNHRVIIH